MSVALLTDTHIIASGRQIWDTPEYVKLQLPANEAVLENVLRARRTIADLIQGKDKRMLVVMGPCSVHEVEPVLTFGRQLAKLALEVETSQFLVMRTCLEKPRTLSKPDVWPGLIMDPLLALDGSHDFNTGIRMARRIAIELGKMGVPIAMEVMNPSIVPYLDDVLALIWTGARTAQVPDLRRFLSGVSMPFGAKHSTDGDIMTAIETVESASHPNFFFGPNEFGRMTTFKGNGNRDGFVILRGSVRGTNYDEDSIANVRAELVKRSLTDFVMVDCSHKNCEGQPWKQRIAFRIAIRSRRATYSSRQLGVMLECYLKPGRQNIVPGRGLKGLKPGQSVTDGCLSLTDGLALVREAHEMFE